ncbi:MAG: aminoacyl-tRNA hydrolase [Planctomycetes bacterium]|nr:aminoacyl-tRNA hydrolase [Planctomycetota bacterium]
MIEIDERVAIAEEELRFESVRGGGPGGQKVNKTASKVVLLFDVVASPSLDDEAKARILERLASRLSGEGVLRLEVQSERSLQANRRLAVERLVELLRRALHRDPPRRPTKKTRSSQRRRLDTKKRRGQTKKDRGRQDWRD